ncbi:MAG: methyltransferase domain-containing protein [Candidatus Latescibacteria bacterium]|nr:methyltransferase domain-containing protein [Candidatus Latescibacterota bacterium]
MEASPKQYLIAKTPLLRGSVLSIGCGRGADELHLARMGLDVLATDVDPEKLEMVASIAEQEGLDNLKTLRLNIAAKANIDQTFDAIYSGFLLHLIPIDKIKEVVVANLLSLLEPDGVMVMVYRLIAPSRFRNRFQVTGFYDDGVEILDVEEKTKGCLSIIDRSRFREIFGDRFVIEDITEYTEPAYNRMSDDMISEAVGATLRPALKYDR